MKNGGVTSCFRKVVTLRLHVLRILLDQALARRSRSGVCTGANALTKKSLRNRGAKVASPVLPAVRFRANAAALFGWLRESAQRETCKAFMGRVRYCPLEQLIEAATKMRKVDDNTAPTAATGLHMKRQAYEFEDEVRMLWIDRKARRDGHAIPFEPTGLFDQIMIGPTKNRARYSEVEATLVSLGIPRSLIQPSSVWTPPKIPNPL